MITWKGRISVAMVGFASILVALLMFSIPWIVYYEIMPVTPLEKTLAFIVIGIVALFTWATGFVFLWMAYYCAKEAIR